MKVKAHPQLRAYLSREEASEVIVLDDTNDSEDVQEMKRLGLYFTNETADIHERIKKYVTPLSFLSSDN